MLTRRTVHPTLNATVEMLYFESRPDFFVTAGLWLPADDAPGKDRKLTSNPHHNLV